HAGRDRHRPPLAARDRSCRARVSPARPSFFCRRKSKDEKRLFFCEWRMRDPHAPRFSTPKALRGAIAQYLPSRGYRLVTGSLKVREFHSYLVDVRAIIFDMKIESGHNSAPISAGGSTRLSLPPTPGGPCRGSMTISGEAGGFPQVPI